MRRSARLRHRLSLGVGNTFGSQENFESLVNDVEHKLFDRLPDDTCFYPGHGHAGAASVRLPQACGCGHRQPVGMMWL